MCSSFDGWAWWESNTITLSLIHSDSLEIAVLSDMQCELGWARLRCSNKQPHPYLRDLQQPKLFNIHAPCPPWGSWGLCSLLSPFSPKLRSPCAPPPSSLFPTERKKGGQNTQVAHWLWKTSAQKWHVPLTFYRPRFCFCFCFFVFFFLFLRGGDTDGRPRFLEGQDEPLSPLAWVTWVIAGVFKVKGSGQFIGIQKRILEYAYFIACF